MQAARRAAGAAGPGHRPGPVRRGPGGILCVRPPGHHAERAAAMGFCFFNNVAVGIRQALDVHGLQRVALIDFDVHHGNGSADIFQRRRSRAHVLHLRAGDLPLLGRRRPGPNMVNVGLPSRSGSDAFRAAVTERWLPALDAFAPELIYISAGFDGHREDDMGNLGLVEATTYGSRGRSWPWHSALPGPDHLLPRRRLRAERAGTQRRGACQGADGCRLEPATVPSMDKHYLTPLLAPGSVVVFAGQADDPGSQTPQAAPCARRCAPTASAARCSSWTSAPAARWRTWRRRAPISPSSRCRRDDMPPRWRSPAASAAGRRWSSPAASARSRPRNCARSRAREGVHLLGPNSLGFQRPPLQLNASAAGPLAKAGPLALVSQSGALTASMLDWARQNGVGFSSVVSLGPAHLGGHRPGAGLPGQRRARRTASSSTSKASATRAAS